MGFNCHDHKSWVHRLVSLVVIMFKGVHQILGLSLEAGWEVGVDDDWKIV